MKRIRLLAVFVGALVLLGSGTTYAQKQDPAALSAQKEAPPGTEPFNRYYIGSSLFMVMNTVASPSPEFYQLNFGYWLTKKDVLSVEAITWTYHRALGTPWGPDMSDAAQAYPGYVRAYGVGVAYQRYLWQGLYAAVHALADQHQRACRLRAPRQPLAKLLRRTGIACGVQVLKVSRFGKPQAGSRCRKSGKQRSALAVVCPGKRRGFPHSRVFFADGHNLSSLCLRSISGPAQPTARLDASSQRE